QCHHIIEDCHILVGPNRHYILFLIATSFSALIAKSMVVSARCCCQVVSTCMLVVIPARLLCVISARHCIVSSCHRPR
ncbi:hypothetical protein PIB30_077760, partial [Stylosanthes scabra]|nr:hypothetical protein [Stylosanthes scabra]